MRILLTGAAGFIGSNLLQKLLALGHEVVASDDFSSGSFKNMVRGHCDIITLDLSGDVSLLRKKGPFEAIFHQASITDTTVMDQKKMMVNNVEAFRNILDLAVDWKSRVVWASSASIYGNGKAPNREDAPPAPLNVYAYSKLAMERLAEMYASQLPEPIIGLRYFNVYGPGEDHKGKFASMIHQLAKQMRAGKRPRVFTAGEQKRDFVYIGDVVSANLAAMNCPTSGIYNVGCGDARSFNDVIAQLNRVLGTKLEPDYFENPYNFTQDLTQADLSRSKSILKYQPAFDLRKGIEAYAESGALGVSA